MTSDSNGPEESKVALRASYRDIKALQAEIEERLALLNRDDARDLLAEIASKYVSSQLQASDNEENDPY